MSLWPLPIVSVRPVAAVCFLMCSKSSLKAYLFSMACNSPRDNNFIVIKLWHFVLFCLCSWFLIQFLRWLNVQFWDGLFPNCILFLLLHLCFTPLWCPSLWPLCFMNEIELSWVALCFVLPYRFCRWASCFVLAFVFCWVFCVSRKVGTSFQFE